MKANQSQCQPQFGSVKTWIDSGAQVTAKTCIETPIAKICGNGVTMKYQPKHSKDYVHSVSRHVRHLILADDQTNKWALVP